MSRYVIIVPLSERLPKEKGDYGTLIDGKYYSVYFDGKIFLNADVEAWCEEVPDTLLQDTVTAEVKSAEYILEQEIDIHAKRLLLEDSVFQRHHNGITYEMVNREIVLLAMDVFASQLKQQSPAISLPAIVLNGYTLRVSLDAYDRNNDECVFSIFNRKKELLVSDSTNFQKVIEGFIKFCNEQSPNTLSGEEIEKIKEELRLANEQIFNQRLDPNKEKPFYTAYIRTLEKQVAQEEISHSRMIELMNERAFEFFKSPRVVAQESEIKECEHHFVPIGEYHQNGRFICTKCKKER